MGDPVELTPAELDRIEDALELLCDSDDAALRDASPIVREHLAAYREILALSRDALPMQEVPTGLLHGVLAEAREAAETTTIEPALPSSRSWWDRWRNTLVVPGLALAASAALVLVIVGPQSASEPELALDDGRVARVDAALDQAPSAKAEELASTATPAAPLQEPAEEAAEADEADEATPAVSTAERAEVEVPAGPPPAKLDAPLPEGGGSPRWDIVARGDRARQAGDCKRASAEYAMALTDDDTRVRARAYAGLGLCDAAEGRFKEASDRYQRAKELDPDMEAFIEDQRPRGSRGGGTATKARRAAPAASKAKPTASKPSMDTKNTKQAFE